MPFAPGSRLADRYVLTDRIGVGGMGEVWRADDEVLGRVVAVKALALPLAADPALRDTTRREARAASSTGASARTQPDGRQAPAWPGHSPRRQASRPARTTPRP
jgi:hypothetical protein